MKVYQGYGSGSPVYTGFIRVMVEENSIRSTALRSPKPTSKLLS